MTYKLNRKGRPKYMRTTKASLIVFMVRGAMETELNTSMCGIFIPGNKLSKEF